MIEDEEEVELDTDMGEKQANTPVKSTSLMSKFHEHSNLFTTQGKDGKSTTDFNDDLHLILY